MKPKPIKKLYYSISEVSKLTDLKQYVLRYWETEFPELRPSKNRAGNRTYRLNDIKVIFLIKKLLYDEKYTIEGARQQLKASQKDKTIQLDIPLNDGRKEELIADIRRDLIDLLAFIRTDSKEEKSDEVADTP